MTGPIFDTHAHYSARAFDCLWVGWHCLCLSLIHI